jgi:mannose-1-phosphate guanylyltransferase
VAFFPSDHHFPDEEAFSACVNQAFEFGESHRDTVLLLGIKPTHPETGYGWIEPGEPVRASGPGFVHCVRGFWEKPSPAAAAELIRRGCLWNSFVMTARVGSLLSLVRNSLPGVFRSFQELAPALFTKYEETSVHKLYQNIEPTSFSKDVLSVCSCNLAVLYSTELEWSDIGDVERALSLMGCKGPSALRKNGSRKRETTRAMARTA